MKDLVFEKAHVHAIKLKLANSKVAGTLEVRANLTPELANAFGVKWMLFNKSNEQRVGYAGVDLDVAMVDFGFTLKPQGLAMLNFGSGMASEFRVEKRKDGKSKVLLVVFRVRYSGNVTDLIGWWEINGAVPGVLTLRAKADQEDLFAAPRAEDAKKRGRPAKQTTIQDAIAETAGKVAGKKAGPRRVQ